MMKDLRQTSEYARYMESIGWTVDGKPGSFAYIKKLPLIGSFMKIQRPERFDLPMIDKLQEKYNALQVIVEPKFFDHPLLLAGRGYKQSKSCFVPSKTVQIDLTKTEKQLLAEMHYKTRYNIRKNLKPHTLVISTSKDIEAYADYWQLCALKQRGMFLSQKREITSIYKSFGKNAHIVQVRNKQEVLSAVMLIIAGRVAYYMFAASTEYGKKVFAPTLNVWGTLRLAKKRGCKIFDFEGIYDERFPIKSWAGFTRFKKSFGGITVEFPGTYFRTFLPRFFNV